MKQSLIITVRPNTSAIASIKQTHHFTNSIFFKEGILIVHNVRDLIEYTVSSENNLFIIEDEKSSEYSVPTSNSVSSITFIKTHLRVDIINNLLSNKRAQCLVTISCVALQKICNEVHPGGIEVSLECRGR